MARTIQTRKRSRNGAASNRPFKRSRRVFKRRKGGSSISRGYASKAVTVGYLRPKRLSARQRRQWKNKLIRNTDTMVKWSSLSTSSATMSTPATLTGWSNACMQMMKGIAGANDLTNPTNWISLRGGTAAIATNGGAPVCRGGFSELSLAHEQTETMQYKVEIYYSKDGIGTGTWASPASLNKGVSVLVSATGNTDFKLLRQYEGYLEQNTAKTFRFRIPPFLLDYQDFNGAKNIYFWSVSIGNTVTATAVPVTGIVTESVWFAGADIVS